MTVQEAKAEIARLQRFIREEKARIAADDEARLVEAHSTAKRLCDYVAGRTNLDPWKLFSPYHGARYTRVRGIVYWKLHKMGYDTKTIGRAFGRRSDIASCVRRVEMKLKIQKGYREYVDVVLGR